MEANEKLIEKIKKLLALGNSANEHEAKLAAEKVSDLLTKHNLSMQQVTEDKTYQKTTMTETTQRMRREDKWIMPLLRDFFFVKPIVNCVTARGRRRVNTYVLVGQPVNTTVAAYIFDFLILQYRQQWKDYKAKFDKSEDSREAYYHGLTHGLKLQLEKQVKRTEQEVGLVVVRDDPGLEKFYREAFEKTTSMKSQAQMYKDEHAAGHGIQAGKSLNLRRGLTDKNETSETLRLK